VGQGVGDQGSRGRGRWRGLRRTDEPRLHDSTAIRRRRSIAGLLLVVVGVACIVFGAAAGRADPPPAVQLDPDGVTAVPRTHFFQSPWILYARVDDPRRTPGLESIGCTPRGDLSVPAQPEDLTQYGSRVVDGVPIAAVALLSRSGGDASMACASATAHDPLWLMPSSVAEPFTATGIAILGALLVVAGALTHPATDELPERWRRVAERRRRDG